MAEQKKKCAEAQITSEDLVDNREKSGKLRYYIQGNVQEEDDLIKLWVQVEDLFSVCFVFGAQPGPHETGQRLQ